MTALPRQTGLSFDAVYAAHAAFVWRTLRRLGVTEADVPDAAQEVFLVVHRKLPGFEGRSRLATWLFGICLKVAKEAREKRARRREEGTATLPDAPLDAEQPELVARKQARALLDRALDTLDDDKRAVFVLFELEQLPMAEVAELVGCPAQTAYARLYAGRRLVDEAITRLRSQEVPA